MIDWMELSSTLISLSLAIFLGGLLGLERELADRWAGLRTHMLVSLGAAVFLHAGTTVTRASPAEISRVLQGVAAGVGFIGAGTILKLSDKLEVRGLTTATSVWLSAGVGTACGLRLYPLAISTTVLTLIVLRLMKHVESIVRRESKHLDEEK